MVEVIVSAFCPPGKAIICNRDALGLDGGQLVVVEDDGTKLAIEEAIERQASVLRQFAALVSFTGTEPHDG